MNNNKKKAARFAVLATACAGMRQETDGAEATLWEAMETEFKKLGEDFASEDSQPGLEPATLKAEVTKTLMESDPALQKKFREMVIKGVQEALGNKIIPDNVHGVAVPRYGTEMQGGPQVDARFQHLVRTD